MPNLPGRLTLLGIIVILIVGFIHLIRASHAFEEIPYLGIAFIANCVGAIIAAVGIYRRSLLWGWGLGGVIAVGSIAGYFAIRSSEMPDMAGHGNPVSDPIGVFSIIVEGLFLVLVFAVVWRVNINARK